MSDIAQPYLVSIANYLRGTGAPSTISDIFIDLFNGDPTAAGSSVLATITGSATRPSVKSSLGVGSTATPSITTNSGKITIVSSALNAATVTHLALYDSATGGNLIGSGPMLGGSKSILQAQPVSVPINGLSLSVGIPAASNSAIDVVNTLDGVKIGGVAGVINVIGGTGTYTHTFTSNPGSLFSIDGNNILIAGVLSVGDTVLGIQSDNGAGSVVTGTRIMRVISVAPSWVPGIRPFTDISPVNLPLTSDVIYTPVKWDAATGFNYYAGNKFNFCISAPTDPLIVSNAASSWGNPAQTIRFKAPSGFTGRTGDPDGKAVVIDGATWTSWDFQNFDRTSDTTITDGQAWANCNILTDTGFGVPSPFHGVGTVATGAQIMAGALLKEEFTRGEILHQVNVCLYTGLCNAGSPNFLSPAISGDGNSSNGFIFEGQIMAIPPGTPMPSGLSTLYGAKLFRAMTNYGACVNDTGGTNLFYMGQYNVGGTISPGSFNNTTDITAMINDANILIPLLQKIGPPMDGLLNVISIREAMGPQTQRVDHTTALLNVIRDSDSTNLNLSAVAGASGVIDNTQITNFCSASPSDTGRMFRYYGQVHNFSFVPGTTAPVVYSGGALNTINGQVVAQFNGTSDYFTTVGASSSYFPSTAIYMGATIQVADRAANYTLYGGDAANALQFRIDATTGFVRLQRNDGTLIGVSSTAVPLNTPCYLDFNYIPSTGAFTIWLNRTAIATGTNIVALTSANILLCASGATPGEFFKGLLGDILICNNAMATQDRPLYSIQMAKKVFWGTP